MGRLTVMQSWHRIGVGSLLVALSLAACRVPGWIEINLPQATAPPRERALDGPHAALYLEDLEPEPIWWLEIERPEGRGRVGGYISDIHAHNGAVVVMLGGASTRETGGELAATRTFYDGFAARMRAAGYLTWTLATNECGTPYGGEEIRETIDALDWIRREGPAFLGTERVYLVGYSTGATIVNLVNLEREVSAVASMAGLSSAAQFPYFRSYYNLIALLFPLNTGMCQLGTTMRTYGADDGAGWSMIDLLGRLEDIRSPTIFTHGTADIVYVVENTQMLEARYRQLVADGAQLPELEFVYIPGGDHWVHMRDPNVAARVIEFFAAHPP